MRVRTLILLACIITPLLVYGQEDNIRTLRKDIQIVTGTTKGNIGIALAGLDFKDTLMMSGSGHFPMQSVFKFPLAIYILHLVDQEKLRLNQQIHIPSGDIDTDTWSPMVKDFARGDIDLSLKSLLIYTVSKSDNNGCDALFKLAGGTKIVNQYIHSLGVKEIAIAATEAEMKTAWAVQYTNWATPRAMLQLLRLFYEGKVLKKGSNDFLMRIMIESENSPNRIHGLLPAEAVLAHKTGTSNSNAEGITAAINDVGILTSPNGKHLGMVVFVSDYPGGVSGGEAIIAQVSRLAWDYFTGHR